MKVKVYSTEELQQKRIKRLNKIKFRSLTRKFVFQAILTNTILYSRVRLSSHKVAPVKKLLLSNLLSSKSHPLANLYTFQSNSILFNFPYSASKRILTHLSEHPKSAVSLFYKAKSKDSSSIFPNQPAIIKKKSALGMKQKFDASKSSSLSNIKLKFSLSKISNIDPLENLAYFESPEVRRRNESVDCTPTRSYMRSSRLKERTKLTAEEILAQYDNNIVKKTIREKEINKKIKKEQLENIELMSKNVKTFAKYVNRKSHGVFFGKNSVLEKLKQKVETEKIQKRKSFRPKKERQLLREPLSVKGHRVRLSSIQTEETEPKLQHRGSIGKLHRKKTSVLVTESTVQQTFFVLNTLESYKKRTSSIV